MSTTRQIWPWISHIQHQHALLPFQKPQWCVRHVAHSYSKPSLWWVQYPSAWSTHLESKQLGRSHHILWAEDKNATFGILILALKKKTFRCFVYACLYATWCLVPMYARRGHWDGQNWQMCTPMLVLGINLESSGREVSTLTTCHYNLWDSSPSSGFQDICIHSAHTHTHTVKKKKILGDGRTWVGNAWHSEMIVILMGHKNVNKILPSIFIRGTEMKWNREEVCNQYQQF